jgi:hypothetical protein
VPADFLRWLNISLLLTILPIMLDLGGEIISFGASIVIFFPLNLLTDPFLEDDSFSLLLDFFLRDDFGLFLSEDFGLLARLV